jgi:DNA-binding MarR family transcriptional regulator
MLPNSPTLHAALVRHTGYLISKVGMMAQREFATKIASVGLNPRMWGALNVLDHDGPMTQQGLGQCVGIDPSSMVATIDELEAIGLVERQRHPSDRRAHALHVTPQGREVLSRGRKLAAEAQEELLSGLSAEERAELHRLLLTIATRA